MSYPQHIQDDFDIVMPYWRAVMEEVEKLSPLSKKEVMDFLEQWRLERGAIQSHTMMQLAIGEDKAEQSGSMLKVTADTVERLKTMDLKGITTGPATRMLCGIASGYSDLGLTATQTRQIFNRVADDMSFDIRKHVPELMVFLQGRSNESKTRH